MKSDLDKITEIEDVDEALSFKNLLCVIRFL
jgi:hypothetical protein